MRRPIRIFAGAFIALLASGLLLDTFTMGGRSGVGFPFAFLDWPRALPPIPGVSSAAGPWHFTPLALLADLGVCLVISLLVEGLVRGVHALRGRR